MVFKRFRIQLIIRLFLITIFMIIAVSSFLITKRYYTAVFFSFLIIIAFAEIVWFVEKYYRNINEFMSSIAYNDFTKNWKTKGEKGELTLQKKLFNSLNKKMLEIKIEKQTHYEYLQILISHLKIAIICFNDNEKITLANNQAKEFLEIQILDHLNKIKWKFEDLYHRFININSGEVYLHQLKNKKEDFQLILRCTKFRLLEENHTLLTFQNIKRELDKKEFESWQQLIRILNHEIMNSATPISSMSSELKKVLPINEHEEFGPFKTSEKRLICKGIDVIEKRSKALLGFISSYKNISQLPKPSFEKVDILKLLEDVFLLFQPELSKKNIHFNISKQFEKTYIMADKGMIEQVLINLTLNSIYALNRREKPKISIYLTEDRQCVYINFKDNGKGIPIENYDKIFIPFFTTREGGSGIGLSLSKQIMIMHNGDISTHSNKESGANFLLKFPRI